MISFNEVKEFATDDELVIGLDLKWVRDSRLFPPQFITLNRHQPELYKVSPLQLTIRSKPLNSRFASHRRFWWWRTSWRWVNAMLWWSKRHLISIEVAWRLGRRLHREHPAACSSLDPSRSPRSSNPWRRNSSSSSNDQKSTKDATLNQRNPCKVKGTDCFYGLSFALVVRYKIGEFYSEHYDNRAGHADLRAATIIIYLRWPGNAWPFVIGQIVRDTEAGGATYFPKAAKALPNADVLSGSMIGKQALRKEGLRIYPRQGRAIFFWYKNKNKEFVILHSFLGRD